MTVTAALVRRAIYGHFSDRYAVVFEVASASAEERLRGRHQRRIDALLVRRSRPPRPTTAQLAAQWYADREARLAAATSPAAEPDGLFAAPAPSPAAVRTPAPHGDDGGIDRLALEIKVSRADFLGDVRTPDKQAPWRALAHRHAYAVPAGLVEAHEVPSTSGLLRVHATPGSLWCDWARPAPRAEIATPLPVAIVLDAFYRWSKAEALAKGLTGTNRRLASEEDLRREVERLTHENELLQGQVERAEDATAAWRRRYAVFAPPPCSTCGKPLRPARRGRNSDIGYLRWEHAAVDDEPCRELRRAACDPRVWGSRVPDPEPAYPGDQLEEVTDGSS